MGTPALAAHILERLVTGAGANHRVVGVVTRPDRPRGRGLGMEPSEVGAVAAKHQIPTLKPVKIRTPEFLNELKAFDPDLLVVAAYGRILPNSILDVPKIAPINVHASLLPRHRGAAPIEGAILAGDAETGVTIMRIVEQMDAGPMYFQRKIPIEPTDTQATLERKTRRAWRSRDARRDRSRGTRRTDRNAARRIAGDIHRNSRKERRGDRLDVERRTNRADDARLRSWPVARTRLGGDEVLIWRAEVEDGSTGSAGTIVSVKPAPVVQCGAGRLRLIEVQAPGRKRMPGS